MRFSGIKAIFRRKQQSKLQPLTPNIFGKNNAYYVKEIKRAVKNSSVKNIALSGGYGTGKSSILEQLRRSFPWRILHKTKLISFMTTEFSAEDNTIKGSSGDDEQKSKNRLRIPSGDDEQKSKNRLRIQKEVFRQLFYGEDPSLLRRSRYFRVGRKAQVSCGLLSVIIATVLSNTILLEVVTSLPFDLASWGTFAICSIIAILAYAILSRVFTFIYDHPIKSIGLKDLSVDLADAKPDFEQMLDEIIYLFQRTGYRIVVLEDLDRFNDPLIYEELRQLNFSINNAKNIRHKVTFIYALKDSLIPNPEHRSKIFDITIPVVPFMTTENALDFVSQAFAKVGIQERDVTGMSKVIARNVHDMRVIKAICNTSVVLRDTIIDGRIKGLSVEKIVAIATIRELYPEEYENMRIGLGAIDEAYQACVDSREEAILSATTELDDKRNIEHLMAKTGNEVWSHITQGPSGIQTLSATVDIDGDNLTEADLGKEKFWKGLVDGGIITSFVTYKNGYQQQNQTKTFTSKEIAVLSSKTARIIQVLDNTDDFYLKKLHEISVSDKFAEAKTVITKNQNLIEKMDKIPVAKEILELGLLDELYQSYLSPFVDTTESCELRNFKINYLRNNKVNYSFELSAADIEQLLNDSDNKSLSSVSFYNCSIFNWLITNEDERLAVILAASASESELLLKFYDAYSVMRRGAIDKGYGDTIDGSLLRKGVLASYTNKDEPILLLTKRLAEIYPTELLGHIINNRNLGDSLTREVLFDVALLNIKEASDVVFSNSPDEEKMNPIDFLDYYEDHAITNGAAMNLAKIYVANKRPVEKLMRYKDQKDALAYIVANNMVALTPENLLLVPSATLIATLDKYDLTENNITEIISLNKLGVSVKKHILSQIEKYADKITKVETGDLVAKSVKEKRISLTVEQIELLAGKISVQGTITILLTSSLDREGFIAVLSKLPDPFSRLAQTNKQPVIDSTNQNRQLIGKLKNFGMISKTKAENGRIKVVMKQNFL